MTMITSPLHVKNDDETINSYVMACNIFILQNFTAITHTKI